MKDPSQFKLYCYLLPVLSHVRLDVYPLQAVINHLRKHSHAATYAAPISAPVAQQVISSMKIIMGEDGTKEGSVPACLHVIQLRVN